MSAPAWRHSTWLGRAWASPVTLVGLIWAALSKSAPLLPGPFGERRYLAKGVALWWMERVRAGAYTLGACLFFVTPAHAGNLRLEQHEARHYWQARVWGLFFVPAYLVGLAWSAMRGKGWHAGNPFEVDAARHEKPTPPLPPSAPPAL